MLYYIYIELLTGRSTVELRCASSQKKKSYLFSSVYLHWALHYCISSSENGWPKNAWQQWSETTLDLEYLGIHWDFIGNESLGNPLGIRWQFERVWALCASTSGAKAWRLQPGRVSMREWVSSLECLQHDAVRWQFVSNECNMIQTYSDPVILFFRQQDAGAWCKISIDK